VDELLGALCLAASTVANLGDMDAGIVEPLSNIIRVLAEAIEERAGDEMVRGIASAVALLAQAASAGDAGLLRLAAGVAGELCIAAQRRASG
jgi:hypothetical protein